MTARRHLHKAMRPLLGLLILYIVFRRIPVDELASVLLHSLHAWPWWISGIAVTFLGLLAGALRWHRILRDQGFTLPFSESFRYFFVGQFFNSFFPGACGGDVVRAYAVIRSKGTNKTGAVMTVLMDRAIGLLVFVILGCIMIAFRYRLFVYSRGTRLTAYLMGAFLLATSAGLIVLFRRNLFEHWPLFKKFEETTRAGALLRKAYDVLLVYRSRPRLLVSAIGLSFVNLAALTSACFFFGHSLGIGISWFDYFTFFPIITVFTAVPITPGALGIREALFAGMLHTVDVSSSQAVPLSLLMYAGGLVWSLFGGLIFLLQPNRPHALPIDTAATDRYC